MLMKNKYEGPICPHCEEDILPLHWRTYISLENNHLYHFYTCSKCDKELGVEIMYWDPPGIVTPVPVEHTCSECNETFILPPSENFRSGKVANYVLIRCPKCRHTYGAANLSHGKDKRDAKKGKLDENIWTCERCGESYERLKERVYAEGKVALFCPHCNWTYGIINAAIDLNIEEGFPECQYCSKPFSAPNQKIDIENNKVILYCDWDGCGKVTGITNKTY